MASVHRYRTRKGELRYDVRWRDGAGKQRSRAFSRRKDAERFRVEQDRARQLGQLYDAPPVRFGDFLAGWLMRHERRVRPSTFEREAQWLRRFRVLSRHYVEEVTASRVEEIVMVRGTRQGQISLRLIKRVLADARSRGQRVHEPVFAIEPPRHETRDPRFLTWAEVEELASYCREQRLIVVAALSGLRRGELFALTAASVDLKGAPLRVAEGDRLAVDDGGGEGEDDGGAGDVAAGDGVPAADHEVAVGGYGARVQRLVVGHGQRRPVHGRTLEHRRRHVAAFPRGRVQRAARPSADPAGRRQAE